MLPGNDVPNPVKGERTAKPREDGSAIESSSADY